MRMASVFILSLGSMLVGSGHLLAQDYLTNDGKLKQPLKLIQLQGGFAGFTGMQYTIAPDGSWTSESVFNQKITPKSKGKLSDKDLAKLGALLEKCELLKLPAKSGKAPVNPHTITIEFGDKKTTLVSQGRPKTDPDNIAATPESRFAAIRQAVVDMLTPPAAEK